MSKTIPPERVRLKRLSTPLAGTPWLNVKEAAQYVRLSPDTIRAACAADKLRHSRPNNGRILLRREWLDAWVAQFEWPPQPSEGTNHSPSAISGRKP